MDWCRGSCQKNTLYSADLDDELRENVGDVVVKDGEASVRTDPTGPSKEDYFQYSFVINPHPKSAPAEVAVSDASPPLVGRKFSIFLLCSVRGKQISSVSVSRGYAATGNRFGHFRFRLTFRIWRTRRRFPGFGSRRIHCLKREIRKSAYRILRGADYICNKVNHASSWLDCECIKLGSGSRDIQIQNVGA